MRNGLQRDWTLIDPRAEAIHMILRNLVGVRGGIRTHDSRSHSPEFYH